MYFIFQIRLLVPKMAGITLGNKNGITKDIAVPKAERITYQALNSKAKSDFVKGYDGRIVHNDHFLCARYKNCDYCPS